MKSFRAGARHFHHRAARALPLLTISVRANGCLARAGVFHAHQAAGLIRGGMAFGVFTAPETASFEQITMARAPGLAQGAAVLVSVLLSLNLILLVFNLLPLPPLDGSEIITLFLSDRVAERYRAFMTQPGFHMVGLIVAWHLMGFVVRPSQTLALNLLYPGAGYC